MDVKAKLIDGVMRLIGWLTVRQEELLAIDIRPGSIYVSQLKQEKGKKTWFAEHIYQRHVVSEGIQSDQEHIKNNIQLYASNLRQIVESKAIETNNVAVSLPIASSIIKMVTAPSMSNEELENAIQYESLWENLVQFAGSMDDYSIYWQVVKRDAQTNTMDLLFIASKLSEINVYAEIIRVSGLQAVLMDVRCFPLVDALAFHFGKKEFSPQKVGIVELGTGENYLMIAEGESVYVSDIFLPESGRQALTQAEYDEEAVRLSMTRYAAQLRQALMLYQNRAGAEPIEELLFVSSLPLAEAFIQALSDVLEDVKLSLFSPLEGLILPEQHQHFNEGPTNLSFLAPVLGLSKRKLDVFGYYQYTASTQNINLLPNRENVVRSRKLKLALTWGLFVLILAGGGFIGADSLVQLQENSQLREKIRNFGGVSEDLGRVNAELQSVVSQRTQYESTFAELEGMISPTQQRQLSDMLISLNNSLPLNIWLTEISHDDKHKIHIRGRSESGQSVQQFVSNLNESAFFNEVMLLNMELDKTDKRTSIFELTGHRAAVSVEQGGNHESE